MQLLYSIVSVELDVVLCVRTFDEPLMAFAGKEFGTKGMDGGNGVGDREEEREDQPQRR